MITESVTPGQTIGPFFHYALPFDGGAQLVPLGTQGTVRLHGVVRDGAGAPVPDAMVEIRQAGADGSIPVCEGSLAREGRFTGWGRTATDASGRYSFLTVPPASVDGGAAFFSVVVFARGLLDRLFTRAYLPDAHDAFLAGLTEAERRSLLTSRDVEGDLVFDIHLQGEHETVFLAFPRTAS